METDLAGTIFSLVLDISRSLRKEMLRKKCSCGVNLIQIHALALLQEHTSMIMKEFADAMYIAAPSATTFIDRLVKLGWVRRLLDRKNRKLVRIAITPAGKRAFVKRQKEAGTLIKALISKAITIDDQRNFLRILKGLLAEIRISMPKAS